MVRSPKPLSRSFQKIRKIIEKRVKYDLHYSTLTAYLTSNSVPKGLSLKLNPAMTTLNRQEQTQWENTLEDASLQLMQIIIQHSERKSHELKEAELALRRQADLSEEDLNDLVEYENQKAAMTKERKRRKLERDGVTETITTHVTNDTD